MTMSTKARVALFLALAVVLVAGIAGAKSAGAETAVRGGGGDGIAGICAQPSPGSAASDSSGPPGPAECDDTVGLPVEPDQPLDCGEQASGTGPDASVSFTPCPGDDEPTDPFHGAQPVEPRPGMAGVAPIPFDKVVVGPDDRTLTVFFWSGVEPCYVLDHVDVEENAGAITITLFQGHDPSAVSAVCIEIAVLKKVEVHVDAPVAGRRIADGAA